MIEKFKTVGWFLKNPSTYAHLLNLIKRRFFKYDDRKGEERSMLLCMNYRMGTSNYFKKLYSQSNPVDFYFYHKRQIGESRKKIQSIPYQMGGEGDLNLLYNIVLFSKPEFVLETGVAYGWSSFAILAALDQNQSGSLISVDMPYPKMGNEENVGCAIPKNLKSRWTLIRKPDNPGLIDALSKVPYVDLCHYDSDKSYSGRKWAYPKIWKKLKTGGIFISDDIQDNMGFFDFCMSIEKHPTVVEFQDRFIGVLQKD
jgi:predicted O-methyltransferase YrrM